MDALHYLAYGSNLLPARLRARVPSARVVGTTNLRGWGLRFHKRGRDGSAKCDLVPAPDRGEQVYAAVYALATAELPALDRAEDLGRSYHRRELMLPPYGRVFFYAADPAHIDPRLRPFDWYRDYVLRGATWHGFPEAYQAQIAAVPTVADPDGARLARHRQRLNDRRLA
jgi:hypothetical protein